MEDPLARGLAFELTDVWRQSTLQAEDSTNASVHLDLQALNLRGEDSIYGEILHFPDLQDAPGVTELGRKILDGVQSLPEAVLNEDSKDDFHDLWTFEQLFDDAPHRGRIYSWETFDELKPAGSPQRVAYLAEAGPRAFDMALSRTKDEHTQKGVLPQDVMLRALCSLTLGRSSIFYTWNVTSKLFVSSLPGIPISGLSAQSSSSLVARVLAFGSAYRALEDFTTTYKYTKPSVTALVALKGCIADMLGAVERYMVDASVHCRSLLQLQCLVERPHRLLVLLSRLIDSIEAIKGDDQILSTVSNFVEQAVLADGIWTDTLRTVFARISAPWLSRLCADLGLVQEHGVLQVGSKTDHDLATSQSSIEIDHTSQPSRTMPACVSSSDQEMIEAAKRSVEALHQHMPTLAFAPTSVVASSCQHDWEGNSSQQGDVSDKAQDVGLPEMHCWDDGEEQQRFLAAVDARMSRPIASSNDEPNDLRSAVLICLENTSPTVRGAVSLSDELEVDLLGRLRPSIIAHHRLMNETLLRHALCTLGLRHHLDLQHQYHLLGNGDFIDRFTTALFSPDTQSAERRRGNIPTAEAMGLRLAGRGERRWPPASSELRLSLMAVLTETYTSVAGSKPLPSSNELPGGLSFSIRELPDSDIERVMDADSIYALDFLRLQYTPPPCLENVFTEGAMQAYDSVFKLLLRMLRVLFVTTKLRANLLMSTRAHQRTGAAHLSPSTRSHARLLHEAHHIMSLLMSHTMDVGIRTPWQAFMRSVNEIEKELASKPGQSVTNVGLDDVRKLHDQCLGRMRSRLFLRRKQEKIRTAIDGVLTDILALASEQQNAEKDHPDPNPVPIKLSLAHLRDTLRVEVEKPRKRSSDTGNDEDETEAMKILMMRLCYNDEST